MFALITPLAALAVLELLEDFMKYSFADFSQHEKSRISFKFLAPFTARIMKHRILVLFFGANWQIVHILDQ